MNRDGAWMKAQASAYDGNCVAIARTFLTAAIRRWDEPEGDVLRFSPRALDDFLAGAKDGEFDLV